MTTGVIVRELFTCDVVDSDGDIIPRAVAQEAIKRFNENRRVLPVTREFDRNAPAVGRVVSLYLKGDVCMVEMVLTKTGEDLIKKKQHEAAVGGVSSAQPGPRSRDAPRALSDLDISEVGLTKKKIR